MFTRYQHQEIIKRRHEIVVAYCKEKGWEFNPIKMSHEQTTEIRSQQNWIDVPEQVKADFESGCDECGGGVVVVPSDYLQCEKCGKSWSIDY